MRSEAAQREIEREKGGRERKRGEGSVPACVREMNRAEEHGRVNWEMQIKPGPAQIEPEKA